MSEFDLIHRYFVRDHHTPNPSVHSQLGIGDDAALLTVPAGYQLAVSVDTLVNRVHFLPSIPPKRLGYRALAVNLSDMAAMGAKPVSCLLALTLPDVDEKWLSGFSEGFFELADRFGLTLIGGDTTRGPLSISVTILGQVPTGSALQRSGAKVEDDLWVSGSLGDAAFGLQVAREQDAYKEIERRNKGLAEESLVAIAAEVFENPLSDARRFLLSRYEMPEPRVALGQFLLEIATSAIDISDGLLGDIRHIGKASGVCFEIDPHLLPMSSELSENVSDQESLRFALTGGDDYELCFTANAQRRQALLEWATEFGLPVTRIGRAVRGEGVEFRTLDQSVVEVKASFPFKGLGDIDKLHGYRHF